MKMYSLNAVINFFPLNIKLIVFLFLIPFIALSQTKTERLEVAEERTMPNDIKKIETFGNYIISKRSNKVGVYNIKSKSYIIPLKYSSISIFNKRDTIFIASFSEFENVTKKIFNKKTTSNEEVKKKVLLSKNNKAVSEIYNEIKFIEDLNVSLVKNNEGFYNILNSTLKEVAPTPYELLYTEYDSEIILAKQKGKYGVIDKNNKVIIPIIYDYILNTYDDRLIVKIDEKAKIVNLKNEIILNTNFESISKPDYNNNHIVKNKFRKGVIDKNGKLIIPLKYKEIRIRNSLNAYFVYENRGGSHKVGLYDLQGKLKIPTEYKYLTVVNHKNSEIHSSTNRLIAKKDGKYGVIDLDNNTIINHKYKSIKVIEKHVKNNIFKNLKSELSAPEQKKITSAFFEGYVYEIIDFEKNVFLMNEKKEIIKINYHNTNR